MAEQNEKPAILIAGKGMSVEQMKKGEGKVPEYARPSRNFSDIQDELLSLRKAPDKNREEALKFERARIINEAKEIGVFVSLKGSMLEIQAKYPFADAYNKIKAIDINRLEAEARGLRGWREEFSGTLEHYRDGALRNMQLAEIEVAGQGNSKRAKGLKREIDLLGWGVPPAGLERLVREPSPAGEAGALVSEENLGLMGRIIAEETAKAQGLLRPEDYLEIYRKAEEFLKAPFQIVPGSEPRFWPIISEKKRDEWVVRSTLVIAAYKKNLATGTDKLYMDEMRELAVDLNKRALKILFGSRDGRTGEVEYEGIDGVLPAAGIYATVIGDPRFLSYERPDDLSLKDVLCDVMTDKEVRDGVKSDYGEENYDELLIQERDLYNGCPDSIYPHNREQRGADGKPLKDKDGREIPWGTPIDQESFNKLRESIRYWLVTKGRDLLLTDEERKNREDFFEGKQKAYQELKTRARDAEQIAWNFIYSTSLLEHFDSRDFRPLETKRHGPSFYWTLFQWVALHPQERFEIKIVRYTNEGPEAKEEWAALGTWGVKNESRGSWSQRQPDGSIRFKVPRILPDTIIRSALVPSTYEVLRDPNGKHRTVKDATSFFGVLNRVGNTTLFDTRNAKREELESWINWGHISDSPFVPYIYDEMRWADVVLQVFKKGQGSKINLADLGEAVRNLRLDTKQRENLLIAYYGANPQTSDLRPKELAFTWKMRLSVIKEYFPNYFLEE